MSELEELKLAYAECSRQRNELLNKLKSQAQQESVGYVTENGVVDWNVCAPPVLTDLYTSPPQRKPLTDEEFLELILRTGTQELVGVAAFVGGSIQMRGKIGLLRSAKIIKEFVEAAHGIKENTQPSKPLLEPDYYVYNIDGQYRLADPQPTIKWGNKC